MDKQFKFNIFSSEMGAANILVAVIVAGIALLVGKTILDRGVMLRSTISEQIGSREARVEAQKIQAAAGFVIANNLVVCKEGGFERGKMCDWRNNSLGELFNASRFGFGTMKHDDNGMHVTLVPEKLGFTPSEQFKILRGTLTFKLVDGRGSEDLQRFTGARPPNLDSIDKDHSFIRVTLRFDYQQKQEVASHKTISYYRRPIAVLTTSVRSDSVCSGQCQSSISQNPNPSCRGPQAIDENARVDIVVKTTNNGPGALYALSYDRNVCFYANPGGGGGTCDGNVTGAIKVNVPDVIEPEKSVTWVDQVPCRRFVGTTNNPALAAAPQHITKAGGIKYILDARNASDSNLEPFRMNHPVDENGSDFPGLINLIYVVPTH